MSPRNSRSRGRSAMLGVVHPPATHPCETAETGAWRVRRGRPRAGPPLGSAVVGRSSVPNRRPGGARSQRGRSQCHRSGPAIGHTSQATESLDRRYHPRCLGGDRPARGESVSHMKLTPARYRERLGDMEAAGVGRPRRLPPIVAAIAGGSDPAAHPSTGVVPAGRSPLTRLVTSVTAAGGVAETCAAPTPIAGRRGPVDRRPHPMAISHRSAPLWWTVHARSEPAVQQINQQRTATGSGVG